jgi:hypothetical protein
MIVRPHPLPYISGLKKTCQGNQSILGPSDHILGLLVREFKRNYGKITLLNKYSEEEPINGTILIIEAQAL